MLNEKFNNIKDKVLEHLKTTGGMERINKKPTLIFLAFAVVGLLIIMYSGYLRTVPLKGKQVEQQKSEAANPPSFGSFRIKDRHDTPAIYKEKRAEEDRKKFEKKNNPVVIQNNNPNKPPPPPSPDEEAWAKYREQMADLQKKRTAMALAGLRSSIEVSNGDVEQIDNDYTNQTKAINTKKDTDYLDYYRTGARNKLEVKEGTFLPAVMITSINSDSNSIMKASIRQNVYDSLTGEHVLIPQGTTLIGTWRSSSSGTKGYRLTANFDRLIFPDQSSIDLSHFIGENNKGEGGFQDVVKRHWITILSASFLSGAFQMFQELGGLMDSGGGHGGMNSMNGMNSPALDQRMNESGSGGGMSQMSGMSDSMFSQIGSGGQQVMQRDMYRQPTTVIRSGYKFNVFVEKDMVLPEYHDQWHNEALHHYDLGKVH